MLYISKKTVCPKKCFQKHRGDFFGNILRYKIKFYKVSLDKFFYNKREQILQHTASFYLNLIPFSKTIQSDFNQTEWSKMKCFENKMQKIAAHMKISRKCVRNENVYMNICVEINGNVRYKQNLWKCLKCRGICGKFTFCLSWRHIIIV